MYSLYATIADVVSWAKSASYCEQSKLEAGDTRLPNACSLG